MFPRHFQTVAILLLAVALSPPAYSSEAPLQAFRVTDVAAYLDDSAELRAVDVLALPDSVFESKASTDPNFGFYSGNVWLTATVHRISETQEDPVFEVGSALLDDCEIFLLTETGPRLLVHAGDHYVFSQRVIPHRYFRVTVPMETAEAVRLMIRASSGGEQLCLPLSAGLPAEMLASDQQDSLIRGIYYGLILFVLLLNLFIYMMIRERASLYYLVYNFTLLLLQLSLSGWAFEHLWPEWPALANAANPFFASVSVYALIRFSEQFLQLEEHFPRIRKVFVVAGYVLLINACVSLLNQPALFSWTVLLVNGLAFLLNIAIIPIALILRKKQLRPATFFLAGFVVLVITVFGFILNNAGVVSSRFFAEYGLLFGSAAEVLLLSLAIVDKFRLFKESAVESLKEINRVTREANEHLEIKVQERTAEIAQKKEELLSSIRYAERIQKNLLPSAEQIRRVFPESFVYFRPRDIVSGDFYWVGETTTTPASGEPERLHLLAVADCTGHGVPGAFMSVLGFNLLQQSLTEQEVNSPGDALSFIGREIEKALSSTQGEGVSDGMDLCLCAINPETHQLYYAGANLGLFMVRNGELIELEGDKGGLSRHSVSQTYQTRSVRLMPGDLIYLSSDGLKDQFGGSRGKKLKWSGFTDMLKTLAGVRIEQQDKLLHTLFNEWIGQEDQIDDICVVGMRYLPR